MTKTMRLMALGLSVVVFTGCSAVDDLIEEYADDQEEEYQGYQDDSNTNSGGTNPAAETGIAYYIDSAVSGVNYKCGSKEGITGSLGEFTFEVGSSCTFYLGDMELRGVDAGLLVNGENVYETDVKIARILQSLDSDGDPSNGIKIEAVTVQALAEEGISSLPTSEAEMDDMLAVIADNGGTEVSEDDAAVHMLTTLLAGKTLYTGVWGEMATFESMSFALDLKSSSWQEIVDVDDRLDNGNGTLTIDGMVITYTCTYDSGYDNPSECSNEEPFIMTVTEIRADHMLVLSQDEDGVEGINRVYYDEAKAREYFLSGQPTQDLTAVLGDKTFYVVGQQVNDATDIWGGEVIFNADLTGMTYVEAYGLDTGTIETISLSVDGNRLIFGSQTSYTVIGENKGDYIEVTDFHSDGSLDSNTRFYFDKTKADAYVATLDVAFSFTTDYLNGKSLYYVQNDDFGHEEQIGFNVAEMTFNSDGTMIWNEIETIDSGAFNTTYSVDENGHLFLLADQNEGSGEYSYTSKTSDYIKVCQISNNDCNTYFFFDRQKALDFRDSQN